MAYLTNKTNISYKREKNTLWPTISNAADSLEVTNSSGLPWSVNIIIAFHIRSECFESLTTVKCRLSYFIEIIIEQIDLSKFEKCLNLYFLTLYSKLESFLTVLPGQLNLLVYGETTTQMIDYHNMPYVKIVIFVIWFWEQPHTQLHRAYLKTIFSSATVSSPIL